MEDKSAEDIWRFYNARCNSENSIKEAKQSFHLDRMPSSGFLANEAYLGLVQLAYNLIIYALSAMIVSFASHAVMNGMDLYTLQKILDHSSIEMTERYSHLSKSHLKKSAKQGSIWKNITTLGENC